MREKRKNGFTLAEVLITLAIVGVVAAITIPSLLALINDKVNANRREVIEDRLIQGLNQLNTLDDGMNASQYEKTEDFVKALSKYYKMSQICAADEMSKCFPYATITYTDDEGEATANVTDLKTPEAFKLSSEEYLAPASFISAQGTPFVMLLKKDCVMDTGTAMRGIPTSCIQYMYDKNGSTSPNKLGSSFDIQHSPLIGIASTASEDGGGDSSIEPDGVLDYPISAGGKTYTKYYFYPEYPILNTCDKVGEPGMGNSGMCQHNYWAAAVETCKALGEDYELPPKQVLQELYCRLKGYDTHRNAYYRCSIKTKDSNLESVFNAKGALSYGGPYWSSSADSQNYAWYVTFKDSDGRDTDTNPNNNLGAICLSK